MANEKIGWVKQLDALLSKGGFVVTLDPYRNITKGCGLHCKAWERSDSGECCENHQAAIERDDYKVE